MSRDVRPRPTIMTICDLCDQEIEDRGNPHEFASLTHGYIAGRVQLPETKHVRFWWHPRSWSGSKNTYNDRDVDRNGKPVTDRRQYDFHARCILFLVEENLRCYANGDRP